MNVLITGGCGFLGSNVASRFLQDGARVTVIDKMQKSGSRENLRWLQDSSKHDRELEFHEMDVASIDRTPASIRALMTAILVSVGMKLRSA